jgi:uncharacterized damage-inducible protein DinB
LVDVRKLLEYNEKERHAFFDKFKELSWDELTKNREASFHSIRNIFVHTLNAVDYWLDFLQNESLLSRKKFDEYGTLEEMRAYMEQVEKRMHGYLRSLSPEGLVKKYKVPLDEGKVDEVAAEDILVHVFEEEVHHRGELIALFWQMDIEPPLTGYPP